MMPYGCILKKHAKKDCGVHADGGPELNITVQY